MTATDDPVNIWKSKPRGEKIIILCIVFAEILAILIVVGPKIWTGSIRTSTFDNQKLTYGKRYTVNSDVIYAATSLAAFDTMMNYIMTNDKETISRPLQGYNYFKRGQGPADKSCMK
jgi:glutamine cyclotransferase